MLCSYYVDCGIYPHFVYDSPTQYNLFEEGVFGEVEYLPIDVGCRYTNTLSMISPQMRTVQSTSSLPYMIYELSCPEIRPF